MAKRTIVAQPVKRGRPKVAMPESKSRAVRRLISVWLEKLGLNGTDLQVRLPGLPERSHQWVRNARRLNGRPLTIQTASELILRLVTTAARDPAAYQKLRPDRVEFLDALLPWLDVLRPYHHISIENRVAEKFTANARDAVMPVIAEYVSARRIQAASDATYRALHRFYDQNCDRLLAYTRKQAVAERAAYIKDVRRLYAPLIRIFPEFDLGLTDDDHDARLDA
jgi:hypothetical protein